MRCTVTRKDRYGHVHPCQHPAIVAAVIEDVEWPRCRKHMSDYLYRWAERNGIRLVTL